MKNKKEIIYIIILIILSISIISLVMLKIFNVQEENTQNIDDKIYNVWSYYSTEYYLNGELYDAMEINNSTYVMTISKEKIEYCFFEQHNERVCTKHDYEITDEQITIYNDESLPAKYTYKLINENILELDYTDEEYTIKNYYEISLG